MRRVSDFVPIARLILGWFLWFLISCNHGPSEELPYFWNIKEAKQDLPQIVLA